MADNSSPALLFAFSETGEHVSEQQFNEWYDGEHVPARSTVPGFTSLARYKAVDGKKPSWLALYDLTSQDVLTSPAYTGLASAASDNERNIIANLSMLNRRIYAYKSSLTHPTAATPGKFFMIALMQPSAEGEEDFNRWYAEEHTELISKVPGWVRSRRFTLVSSIEMAGKPDPANNTLSNPNIVYLAIHELESGEGAQSPELQHALDTPWAKKVFEDVGTNMELRMFALHKEFKPATD